MQLKLIKDEDGNYNVTAIEEFNLGKAFAVENDNKDKVILGINTANVKPYLKERLIEMAQGEDDRKADDIRQDVEGLLEEYCKLHLMDILNIKDYPLKVKEGKTIIGLNEDDDIDIEIIN